VQAIAAAHAAMSNASVDSGGAAKPENSAGAAPPAVSGTSSLAAAAAAASMPVEGVGELEAVEPQQLQAVQAPHRLVVLLYGNPLAGTSVQAAALCSRYGLPCVSIDSLLQVRGFCCQVPSAFVDKAVCIRDTESNHMWVQSPFWKV
jgi:hypothetical protein